MRRSTVRSLPIQLAFLDPAVSVTEEKKVFMTSTQGRHRSSEAGKLDPEAARAYPSLFAAGTAARKRNGKVCNLQIC
jgi:hypothetical protein